MTSNYSLANRARFVFSCVAFAALAACGERSVSGPKTAIPTNSGADEALATLTCTASVASGDVRCGDAPGTSAFRVSKDIIGGQNVNVTLTSSNVSYDAGTETFQFDVTITNLLNERIGTPGDIDADTPVLDPDGIRIFFSDGPAVTVGTGTISVANADGTATFTASDQPYFQYDQWLGKDSVSTAKTWKLHVPNTVESFNFTVYVAAVVRPALVINEVMANPNVPTPDQNGEWFEIYNAGSRSVNLQNLLIADSAASGRRPYHVIAASVVVPAGGYAVIGSNPFTTANGGVPEDYFYSNALALANSLDAIKISRVFGTDTLTIDYVRYSTAAISAQKGIARELKNPALDNLNMDGSNWADAAVTAVYGTGGRGTPRAQNSTFVP